MRYTFVDAATIKLVIMRLAALHGSRPLRLSRSPLDNHASYRSAAIVTGAV